MCERAEEGDEEEGEGEGDKDAAAGDVTDEDDDDDDEAKAAAVEDDDTDGSSTIGSLASLTGKYGGIGCCNVRHSLAVRCDACVSSTASEGDDDDDVTAKSVFRTGMTMAISNCTFPLIGISPSSNHTH